MSYKINTTVSGSISKLIILICAFHCTTTAITNDNRLENSDAIPLVIAPVVIEQSSEYTIINLTGNFLSYKPGNETWGFIFPYHLPVLKNQMGNLANPTDARFRPPTLLYQLYQSPDVAPPKPIVMIAIDSSGDCGPGYILAGPPGHQY
ncbi:MAG: hypothetical protein HY606_13105 [Planctomycetes bacterium]|nr:hypothetical protein [Planctomycetota bacterium]